MRLQGCVKMKGVERDKMATVLHRELNAGGRMKSIANC